MKENFSRKVFMWRHRLQGLRALSVEALYLAMSGFAGVFGQLIMSTDGPIANPNVVGPALLLSGGAAIVSYVDDRQSIQSASCLCQMAVWWYMGFTLLYAHNHTPYLSATLLTLGFITAWTSSRMVILQAQQRKSAPRSQIDNDYMTRCIAGRV